MTFVLPGADKNVAPFFSIRKTVVNTYYYIVMKIILQANNRILFAKARRP